MSITQRNREPSDLPGYVFWGLVYVMFSAPYWGPIVIAAGAFWLGLAW